MKLGREQAGKMLLVLAVAVSNLLMLGKEFKEYRSSSDTDMVTLHEKRFAGLKNDVLSRCIVGYISDRQSDDLGRVYFLTQYSLAPVIVRPVFAWNEKSHRYIIGDFYKTSGIEQISGSKDFRILKKLDNGVMLLETR